ncbi:MAG: Flp pilus assembly protein CpaB [Granulosicoccus sp.]
MQNRSEQEKTSRRPVKGIVMFVVSLGAGAAGVYYSQQYIEHQVATQSADNVVEQTLVEVVVPARDMLRGEIVFESELVTRKIPEQYVDSNSVSVDNYELALGQRMDFDLDEGRPLLWAHLAGGVTPTFSGKVKPGLRAMTVRVDDINSISGFLQPGDRVDLLMSYGADSAQRILPLMEQLNVIATGIQTETDKLSNGEPRSFSTITVHVTPADAQKLTLAQQVGKLTAILRHPDDDGALTDSSLSVAQLLAGTQAEKTIKRTRRVPALAKAPVVEYIIGGE